MSLKNRAVWLALVTVLFGAPAPAEEFHIYFKTSPPAPSLRPLAETTTLSLLVTAADGRPVREGWLAIGLDAPAASRFFSTDFPVVEGKPLADVRLPLRRGKAEWRYLFPIRGEYRLSVDYLTSEGKQASQTFKFRIRENPIKWIVLGSFMVGLFSLGFIAGRVFSVRQAGREQSAAFLVLCMGCFFACGASAAETKIGQRQYAGRLEIAPATVGQPTRVRWRLLAGDGEEKPTVALTLVITHLEKEKIVFAVEKISVDDEFSMNFHFTDGAQYKLTAIADIPGRRSLRTEETVTVAAVEPPPKAMLPALALFLSAIACGIIAGRWSRVKAAPAQHPYTD